MKRRWPSGGSRVAGFSFVELMFSLAVMAVLASIAVPMIQNTLQREKEQQLRLALQEIRSAIDAYKRANDDGRVMRKEGDTAYPKQLEDLVTGVQDQRSPSKRNLQFLRRIPRDPFAVDQNGNPADSWGKRSSLSSGDNPQEGDDVFDVYSRSNKIGLNKIPLNQW
ncbi:MAG: type II secretion system protein [Burkholderiales bacterium]|nr:type II secretion system protein [Burkholderiales bacterium]